MWVLQEGSFYFSSSLLFFVVSMYVCDCLFALLSVMRRQLSPLFFTLLYKLCVFSFILILHWAFWSF